MNDTNQDAREVLDTTGLLCPEPVMLLHAKVATLKSGDLLEVIATDPSTRRDIPKFCNFLGHTLVSEWIETDQFLYLIKIGQC